MAPSVNPAVYKKNSGYLTVDPETDELFFQVSTSQPPSMKIQVTSINSKHNPHHQESLAKPNSNLIDLQVTPESSAKCRLKVICKPVAEAGAAEDAAPTFLFSFTTRDVMTKVKDILQQCIQKSNAAAAAAREKEQEQQQKQHAAAAAATDLEASRNSGGGATASSSNANGSSGGANGAAKRDAISLDSKRLLQDLTLQQGLLKENKELMKTFQETVIQNGLPYEEFWSTRVHVLRAYALTTSQRRGPYNVLSTIKPTTDSENKVVVSVSREKIHDIFDQYPLVRHAYNECVPKISEGEFWSRFFLSRLFRRLKGERQKPSDPTDLLLDKYLDYIDNSSLTGMKRKAGQADLETDYTVPFFLDIAGNEESDPQKLGNRPDMTMRSGTEGSGALSLIQTMNNLSQKMTYGPTAAGALTIPLHDQDGSHLAGELKLDELDDTVLPDYMELHLKNSGGGGATEPTATGTPDPVAAAAAGPPKPHADVMSYIRSNLAPSLDLQQAGLAHPDPMQRAQKQIAKTIKLRAKEGSDNRTREERETEQEVHDLAHLTHATSVEFLRHFWIHFQSGDAAQAPAITKSVASLKKSLQRVTAVEKSAPPESQELVKAALAPLVASIHKALLAYNKALAELAAANGATAAGSPMAVGTPVSATDSPAPGVPA